MSAKGNKAAAATAAKKAAAASKGNYKLHSKLLPQANNVSQTTPELAKSENCFFILLQGATKAGTASTAGEFEETQEGILVKVTQGLCGLHCVADLR